VIRIPTPRRYVAMELRARDGHFHDNGGFDMPKHTAQKETIRRLAEAGRALADVITGALLPQPRPQHRPIPIPVNKPRQR
jgi:hypothetical protein